MSGQSGGHRLRLSMLNDQLTCKLCGGYFIDATTIIECLHSFCRSCIVKYLENNKYCPICEVQVHKSKPLLNIRPDHTLQDIVYKLVPACYQNEMRCRREFYAKNPEALRSTTSPEARGEPVESHIYSPDESLILSLEYYNPVDQPILVEAGVEDAKESGGGSKKQLEQKDEQLQQKPLRYLRCPAAVMVFHLQKLIRAKYGLSDAHRVDVMYKEETLCDNYTLMDVMYIYHWRRKVPLHLSYRIFESSPKRLKLSEDNENFKQSLTNAGIRMPVDSRGESHGQQQQQQQQQQSGPGGKREWKEVQLKISETGVMSVTDITSPDSKKNAKTDRKTPGSSANSGLEDRRKLDEPLPPDDVNKSESSLPDAKREKTRDGRFASTETSKTSEEEEEEEEEEKKKRVEPKKTESSTRSVDTPMERDIERGTVRETRSRSDLRSAANLQEAAQALSGEKNVQRSGAETRRSKISLPETSGTGNSEKLNTMTKGSSERVSTVATTTEESKTDNRSQSRVSTTNNNLTNSTNNSSRVSTSNDNLASPTQTSKPSKNQETKNSQQASAGSKIDALSAKLQFQPKISEANNTFSKKGPKEKRIEKAMKKSSAQASLSSSSAPTSVTSSSALSSPSPSLSFTNESSLTVKTLGKHSDGGILKTRSNSSALMITSGKSVRIESSSSSVTTSSAGSQIMNCLGGATIISTTSSTSPSSVSISVTTLPKPNDNFQAASGDRRVGMNSAEESSLSITSGTGMTTDHRQQASPSSNQNLSKNCFGRRENQNLPIPSSESLASIGLNVSTSMQTTTNFPYTVHDLVNPGILKNSSSTTKSGLTIQKTTSTNFGNAQMSNNSGSLVSSSLSQACSGVGGTPFNLHTPSLTIYSVPTSPSSSSSMKTATTMIPSSVSTTIATATTTTATTTTTTTNVLTTTTTTMTTTTTKNSPSGNVASSLYSNASTQITNSSSGNKVPGTMEQQTSGAVPKSNSLEITNIYSSTVPPCPAAIPISLMKPAARKHEVIAKGTNVNEICAKIGTTGGSKINDICAKIGESTKEKNKAESAARNRPEIPDLLKIGKKPLQSSAMSLSEGATTKHIPNIPNVPIYTPSNTVASSPESKMYSSKESSISKLSASSPLASVMQSGALQVTKTSGTGGKKSSMSMGYKTLRDPPKSWNPTLTKNNYVAMKNQAKESLQSAQQSAMMMQQQQQEGGNGKASSAKLAKRHNRNLPRFLGNPASGVKPLYGVTEGSKLGEGKDHGTITTSGGGTVGSGKNSSLSMTKLDPKTLSPIVSSSNSPIVSPPPYSPSARGTCYQTTPFSREMCVNRGGGGAGGGGGGGGSPISTRSSPVNILTSPFIPSPTPNTNPRLLYSHFPPPFPDSPRFANPLIRPPLGIPSPSAFHSSLPPSINKIYQRTSYMPQTTGVYSQPQQQQQISQSPAIQRVPASAGHSSPKSPKKSNSPAASFSLSKTETSAGSIASSVSGGTHGDGKNVILVVGNKPSPEANAFNLSKSAITANSQQEERHNPGDYEKSSSESDKTGGGRQQMSPSQAKRETTAAAAAGKSKERDAEKQRRLSSDCDRGKSQREDSGERLDISVKRSEDKKPSSDSGKNAHESDKSTRGDDSKVPSDGGDSSRRETEKVETKINGDVNAESKSSSVTKSQQESPTTKNDAKDSRASECCQKLSNLTQDCKESEGKTTQISQQGKDAENKDSGGGKVCDHKVEDHIGKSGGGGDHIQGKTNKTTNAESQRSKAES